MTQDGGQVRRIEEWGYEADKQKLLGCETRCASFALMLKPAYGEVPVSFGNAKGSKLHTTDRRLC